MKIKQIKFKGKPRISFKKRRFNLYVEVEPSFFKRNSGFTLIEMIVSIAIFTVVMVITIGALLVLNDGSRKAHGLRTVIDNLNFAVEDISRKVRTGSVYHCYPDTELSSVTGTIVTAPYTVAKDCPSGGRAISVKTQDGSWAIYVYDKSSGTGGIKIRKRSADALSSFGPLLEITSSEVNINSMRFFVRGSESPYALDPLDLAGRRIRQPMVILDISGIVDLKKEKLQTDFSLQTAISQREVND